MKRVAEIQILKLLNKNQNYTKTRETKAQFIS